MKEQLGREYLLDLDRCVERIVHFNRLHERGIDHCSEVRQGLELVEIRGTPTRDTDTDFTGRCPDDNAPGELALLLGDEYHRKPGSREWRQNLRRPGDVVKETQPPRTPLAVSSTVCSPPR